MRRLWHGNLRAATGVGAPMANRPVLATVVALLLATAGCGQAPSAAPSAGATVPGPATSADAASSRPTAGPAADPDAIDHPTGATDVVLRVRETGGFVHMDAVMARVPLFTLYGDGRVLIAAPPNAKGVPGALGPLPVLMEGRLTEPEIQAVLATALTDGRLGVAQEQYAGMAMDLPTTVFEVRAGGVEKTVSVGGLGAEPQPGPDAPVLTALAELARRLLSIRADAPYEAPAWMAVIAEWERDPAQPAAAAWPWPDLPPDGFVQPGDADPIPFPRHLLTHAEAEASGADLTAGGATGLRFEGPDGRLYVVALRPALPEEAAAG